MPVNLGSTAVAAGSAYVGSDPVAVYIGSDLVLARVAAPTFNQQTFTIAAAAYQVVGTAVKEWNLSPRQQVNAALIPTGTTRYLQRITILSDGRVTMNVEAGPSGSNQPNRDLSSEFEMNGSIKFENATAGTIIISTEADDDSDPYTFTPANSTDVTTFFNALSDTTDAEALTLTLADGTLT